LICNRMGVLLFQVDFFCEDDGGLSYRPSCHQRSGSTDDRRVVSIGHRRGSMALALAAVSKVWSCVPAVAGGPWPGVSASLRVGVCG
jgi:adenine deaminase